MRKDPLFPRVTHTFEKLKGVEMVRNLCFAMARRHKWSNSKVVLASECLRHRRWSKAKVGLPEPWHISAVSGLKVSIRVI